MASQEGFYSTELGST